MSVLLINPLRGTLRHYESALVDVLNAGGTDVVTVGASEPSASGDSRRIWLGKTLRLISSASKAQSARVIVCWPAAGYFDLVASQLLTRSRTSVILHDPHPLIHVPGYGRFARTMANRSVKKSEIIVHSRAAERVVLDECPRPQLTRLPLPILPPVRRTRTGSLSEPLEKITVLGQYKPDRDIDALAQIARAAPDEWDLRIFGKNWPSIQGWTVDSRFLSDHEFAARIMESDVVLIPYRHFYQSDVAIHCVEQGIPCVGPRRSSLSEMLGNVGWLVDDDDWIGAVSRALLASDDEVHAAGKLQHDSAVDAWRDWAAQ